MAQRSGNNHHMLAAEFLSKLPAVLGWAKKDIWQSVATAGKLRLMSPYVVRGCAALADSFLSDENFGVVLASQWTQCDCDVKSQAQKMDPTRLRCQIPSPELSSYSHHVIILGKPLRARTVAVFDAI